MQMTSTAFEEGEAIPRKYTCQGIDINPPLTIFDIPQEAKSLVLIVDDPDVPPHVRADRMWVHWVVYGIDPKLKEIPEGVAELGIQGKNTGGKNCYMGPCPPDREHRYFFKLYALDTELQLQEGATKEEVLHAAEGHKIASAELIGRYEQTH